MIILLQFLFFGLYSIFSNAIHISISEKELVSLRSDLISRLDRCTLWRHQIGKQEAQTLEHFLMNSKFEEFRSAAIQLAANEYPEGIDCIDQCSSDIDKFNKYLKSGVTTTHEKAKLRDLLDDDQIDQLHLLLEKTKRSDLIEKGLHQHFHGMPEKRKQELLSEFFSSKPLMRKARSADDAVARDPEPIKPEWLKWQTSRQKSMTLQKAKNSKWEEMNLIADQFYHLRRSVRKRYEANFYEYCNTNIRGLIGNDSFSEINNMYSDSDHVEQIANKYQEFVGNMQNESDRLTADHYGEFCRKIYRLIPFEQIDFMSWLSFRQKIIISDMIQDSGINDEQVYEKLYQFFNQTIGDAKENADDIITKGCRRFIAHHLGDTIAEEIEDMRVAGNISSQYLAILLSVKNIELELEESAHKKRVDESLSICKRIYLDYDGRCDCNGHSEKCDSSTHKCENCEDNTSGFMCELCAPNFERDNVTDECIALKKSVCSCNLHSTTCDNDGKCINCAHNTTGDYCEHCTSGHFGDPTSGQPDSCSECPCPHNGDCSIDSNGFIECPNCPTGFIGQTCDVNSANYTIYTTSTTPTTEPVNVTTTETKIDNTL